MKDGLVPSTRHLAPTQAAVVLAGAEHECYRSDPCQLLVRFDVDETIVSICSINNSLWILTSACRIRVVNLSNYHDTIELDEQQFSETSIHFVSHISPGVNQIHPIHISCSQLGVWLIGDDNQLFYRHQIDARLLQAWIAIDTPTELVASGSNDGYVHVELASSGLPVRDRDDRAAMIVTNTSGTCVLLLSHYGRMFARAGVTAGLPVGESWTEVGMFIILRRNITIV